MIRYTPKQIKHREAGVLRIEECCVIAKHILETPGMIYDGRGDVKIKGSIFKTLDKVKTI